MAGTAREGAETDVEHRETVRPEWIDYNGHMNVAYYVLVFDHATDGLFDRLGCGRAYAESGAGSVFVVESHVAYQREALEGERLLVTTRLLATDGKRLHFHHLMRRGADGERLATIEIIAIHVDLRARRAAPLPAEVARRAARLAARQAETAAAAPIEARLTLVPRRPG